MVVTFDPVISRTEPESEVDIPAPPTTAARRCGLRDRVHRPTSPRRPTRANRPGPQDASHPPVQRLHGSELERHRRHHPRRGTGRPDITTRLENYLDQFRQPLLNSTSFLTIGYGTEVRQAESGAQTPTLMRQPIVRRYTTEIGQKLTEQILQLNRNEHDRRAGGGTCFGDSGGPAMHDGFVVGDTSYGYTNNCRYLGGYQLVDVPVVRNWLLDRTADLACPTKE